MPTGGRHEGMASTSHNGVYINEMEHPYWFPEQSEFFFMDCSQSNSLILFLEKLFIAQKKAVLYKVETLFWVCCLQFRQNNL